MVLANERVWLDLHANVTRSHRCGDMGEQMRQVVAYLVARKCRKNARYQNSAKTREPQTIQETNHARLCSHYQMFQKVGRGVVTQLTLTWSEWFSTRLSHLY